MLDRLRCAAPCIYNAPISTTGKKDVDPGASSSAGFWAARALPIATWRPAGAFPYMRRHSDAFAKATVDWVFAVVPSLNTNLRARFAGVMPPPGSTWKLPLVTDPPVRAQEEACMGQEQAHQVEQKAQMETYVRAMQNPPLLSPDMVRAPAPSPECQWAPAWAQAQVHEEEQKAT